MEVSAIDDVLRLLDQCADGLARNGVYAWVVRQVIAQLILFITTYGTLVRINFADGGTGICSTRF